MATMASKAFYHRPGYFFRDQDSLVGSVFGLLASEKYTYH